MTGFSNETIQGLENLLSLCDHILESDFSDQAILEMQHNLKGLKQESDQYKEQLQDQQLHSKSSVSKRIAAQMLTEEQALEDLLSTEFSNDASGKHGESSHKDLNIGALFVEYLTRRAMQSVREALIGAMNLKILSSEQ